MCLLSPDVRRVVRNIKQIFLQLQWGSWDLPLSKELPWLWPRLTKFCFFSTRRNAVAGSKPMPPDGQDNP